MLNEKSEDFVSDSHFYVFVALGDVTLPPRYHIVPSREVAAYVYESHRKWLDTPGRNGQAHVDNPVRNSADPDDRYLGRWDLLGLI